MPLFTVLFVYNKSNLTKLGFNDLTLSELSESIDEYMHFYNEVRPHQKLHNLTPNEFELTYYEQNK